MLLQVLIILAIFGITVANSIRKEKQKELERQASLSDLEEEEDLTWYDEANSETLAEESSFEEAKREILDRIPPLIESIEKEKTPFKRASQAPKIETAPIEEEEDLDLAFNVSSMDDVRRGIIWSEILKRKY